MKTFPIIIALLIIGLNTISQSKSNFVKGFEEGFKEGYCYNMPPGAICSYPIIIYPPTPKLNESSDNYTQGYNRGFQYGLDLKRSNEAINEANMNLNQRIVKFNEYISQNPVNAMVAVGMMRQAKYDARKDWIQQRIDGLAELKNSLYNEQTLPNSINAKATNQAYWQKAVDYIYTIRGYDFADDYQFGTIQTNFNRIERYFYDSYNQIISMNLQKETQSSEKESSFPDSRENVSTNNYQETDYEKNYTGIVEVNTCCDILDKPNQIKGKRIEMACDGKVKIISKINKDFYKVEYKSTMGYISSRWIKN